MIFGTVNNVDGYLKDISRNRRFWPVEITGKGEKKPWDLTEEDRGQIWAEIFYLYKKNREKVPLEVLKTKYKKPYEALKNKLAKELQWYINEIAFLGIYDIGKDLKEDGLKKWMKELEAKEKKEETA